MSSIVSQLAPTVIARQTAASASLGAIKYATYVDSNGVDTGEPQVLMRVFNNTGGALLQGGVYAITFSGTEASWLQIIAVAASAFDQEVCVATEAAANQTATWVVISGFCNALVDGGTNDVTDGDWLKLVAATNADAFVQDHATTRSTDTMARACGTNTGTEALTKVLLIGGAHDVD